MVPRRGACMHAQAHRKTQGVLPHDASTSLCPSPSYPFRKKSPTHLATPHNPAGRAAELCTPRPAAGHPGRGSEAMGGGQSV
eukprot:364201-Chlamydomonas_euryale.AAC.8